MRPQHSPSRSPVYRAIFAAMTIGVGSHASSRASISVRPVLSRALGRGPLRLGGLTALSGFHWITRRFTASLIPCFRRRCALPTVAEDSPMPPLDLGLSMWASHFFTESGVRSASLVSAKADACT